MMDIGTAKPSPAERALIPHHLIDVVDPDPVSYTHLRAHETVLDLVCRLLLEKKKSHLSHTSFAHSKYTTQHT